MTDQDFERKEKARQDAMFDAQFADEPTSDVDYADDPPCKTSSQCTNKCQRCGEINPAEIHTCSPEPQVNGWPLYSGLPQPERQQRTYTLRKWQGLTDEEIYILWMETPCVVGAYTYADIAKEIEQALKEKNK